MNEELHLRYGMNPHQAPARIYAKEGNLPIQVLNGAPGYINLLDALNSWQLVKELKQALGLPAAASFKHVSPAGAAVAVPLSDTLRKSYFVDDMELSPVATAYARARGADRMSSFGDCVALSDKVDVATAKLIRREVSDAVIAPDFTPEALSILREKKKGKYVVIQVDPNYQPHEMEVREVFGVTFEQKHNDLQITDAMFQKIVTRNKELPDSAKRDLIVALITLKYTQSNSVCFAVDGQVIGTGAGQQSRVHCVRLAAAKVDKWWLRQSPQILGLKFKPGLKRPDRDNAIDQFLEEDLPAPQEKAIMEAFAEPPRKFTKQEKRAWLDTLKGVALGSDAFFPFRDNIDRAYQSGVQYLSEPGGSLRDDEVIAACDDYGMTMAFSGLRLFHH